MASQKFIIDREAQVIEACEVAERSVDTGRHGAEFHRALSAIFEAREALAYERQVNGGSVYPENRDLWGTLGLNAIRLAGVAPHARESVAALEVALRPEFVF